MVKMMKDLSKMGSDTLNVFAIKKLFSKRLHNILMLLVVAFLLFKMDVPVVLAKGINTPVGTAVIILAAFSLFFTKNPLLVILGFLTAYELVRRSKKYGTYEHVDGYLQEETAKNEERIVENNIQMMKVNDTLEEDMVENITPLIPRAHGDATYAPVSDKKHNASEANGNTMLDI